ncbi:glbN [Symbiodinium sp. CCMP2592]|nr:glbN [Symbiodinium sp. CCMP2592]
MPQAIANVGLHYLEHPGGPDSIFEKLGGQARKGRDYEALEKFVDGFYNMMATDKDMKKFFENRNLIHLKKRTVDYLGGLWGGKAYRGPDLFLAHTGLGVTVKIFELMMKCVEKARNLGQVNKALAKQIVSDIESMKEPLCDPTGKLAKEQNAKNLALGDPFDDAANRAAYAELQRKEEERRQKLIDFRKRKEAEAKDKAKSKKDGEKAREPSKDSKEAEATKEHSKEEQVQDSARMAHLKPAAPKPENTEVSNVGSTDPGKEKTSQKDSVMAPFQPVEKKDRPSAAAECAPKTLSQLPTATRAVQEKGHRKQSSTANSNFIKAKVEKNAEARSGDSGLYSMETTVGNRTEAFSERCEATEENGDPEDWSSVDEDSSVTSARSAGACEMMDWRWSPDISPWNSPWGSPVGTVTLTFEDGSSPACDGGIEEPRCPRSVQLLMN